MNPPPLLLVWYVNRVQPCLRWVPCLYMPSLDPWASLLVLDLDLAVASKSNYRQGNGGWRRLKAFETVLTHLARTSLPASWPPLDADYPLKERATVAVVIVASTLVDTANLPKSITDALEGVCYANDASARAVSALSLRSKEPRAVLLAAAFDPKIDLPALADALARLQSLAVQRFELLESPPSL